MKLGFVCLLALVFSLSSPSSERHKLGRVLLASARRLGLSGSFQAAGGIGGLLAMTQNGSTSQHFYYDDDGAGNITGMFDTNLNQVAYYLYDPYGNPIFASGPVAGINRYGFASKEFMANPRVTYFGGRFYDPGLQRFLNQDPIQELGGINLYRFVQNSPLNRIDPWGLDDEEDDLDQRLDIAANGSAFFADYAYDKETRRRHEQIMCEAKQKITRFLKHAAKEAAIQAAIFVATEGLGQLAEAADLLLAARVAKALEEAGAAKEVKYVEDFATKATKNWSAMFKSEGEARALARTKLGSNPVEVAPGKWRSADGNWQYRAKPGDVADNHIHLEKLNPQTGEVIQNVHLRWPEGGSR